MLRELDVNRNRNIDRVGHADLLGGKDSYSGRSMQIEARAPTDERARHHALFYDLIDAGKDRGWDCQPQRVRGFAIDDELEPGRLLDRQINRLRALENAADKIGGAAIGFYEARAIGE